jgi:hypothetical protein
MSEKNLVSSKHPTPPMSNGPMSNGPMSNGPMSNSSANGESAETILVTNNSLRSQVRKAAIQTFPCATGALLVATSILSGCSAHTGSASSQASRLGSDSYQLAHLGERTSGGSILIARPAPKINVMYAAAGSSGLPGSEPRMLGFAPISSEGKGLISQRPVATIKRSASTVTISGTNESGVVRHMSESVRSGTYKVGLMQRNPRWYAPDSYYTRRNLKVPPAGSAPRFLKGALGVGAIFLQPLHAINTLLQIPLHCAKEFTDDVGGVQVPENTYLELQHALKLGNEVVIE